MYKNKNQDGSRNICGKNIKKRRLSLEPKVSQRILADQLQLLGLDLDKNAVQKIESGERFVTDIEIKKISVFFQITVDALLEE